MCLVFYTNLGNKTQYRRVAHLSRSQKNQLSILFEKVCLGWKLSTIINGQGNWNKNVLGRKKLKNLLVGCDVY